VGREVGLLPVDDESFTIYFAHMPLARFDSRLLRVVPLPKAATGRKNTSSGGGMPPPDEQPKTFLIKEKLSTMCPV